MNKTLLTKIINTIDDNNLDITNEYVEIFSNVKYKDYYLRGQVSSFIDPLYNLDDYGVDSIGHYIFFFFVLVNNEYQQRLKKLNWESAFGIFRGNTFDTFFKKAKNYYKADVPSLNILMREKPSLILTDPIKRLHKIVPALVKKEDLEIEESPYLKKMLKEKKDIILLDMNLILDSLENSPERNNFKIIYPSRIYSFPAFNYSDIWEWGRNYIKDYNEMVHPYPDLDFIKNLFDIICINMDYDYLSRKEFLIILKDIGNLAWDFIKKKKITKTYLEFLNEVQSEIGDRNYPFTNFVYKFLDELIEDLVEQKHISKCQFCGNFFPIDNKRKTKKYCSFEFEGKKCAKKAGNKKHYEKHKKEIKLKARKSMRELRACYEKYGVKK